MSTLRMLSRGTLAGLILLGLLLSPAVLAKVGVGMGAGEIHLDEPVKRGGIYKLPSVRIFNTGDEVTTYGMGIAYHQDYNQLRPQKDWFSFSPDTFTLSPAESQDVSVTMTVPVKAEPGEYFSFIESGPVASNEPGTSVGVAVGTRLFFTVVPSNLFQALTYRTSSFFDTYSPWSWIGLGVFGFVFLLMFFRRFFSFNVSMRKR